MIFREANFLDISQMHFVRIAVKENILSNPDLVTENDYQDFISKRGKGWVCEINNEIVGFSIVDIIDNNIWALFMNPNFEKKGIGKQLHKIMLDWYFNQTKKNVCLGTSPNTRAESFYKKAGWIEIGLHGNNEIKFEMTFENWSKNK